MAPEVSKKEYYDVSADIWSLGMLAIEMCDREPYLHRQPAAALITAAIDHFNLPEVDDPVLLCASGL